MQLSKRLSSVASMVTAGNRLADVGTDHGYVPIYLYQRKQIPGAIAMDVNQGPLERAALHIAENGLKEVIETRLSDGLEALQPGEADSIVIAGMGGPLMLRILNAHPAVLDRVKELILQPQSEVPEVRRWLYAHDYEIMEEHLVFEDGKYYPMFRAVKGTKGKKLTGLEYKFGRLEVLKEPDVLEAYIKKELENKRTILDKLEKEATRKSRLRAKEIEELLHEIEAMLERLA